MAARRGRPSKQINVRLDQKVIDAMDHVLSEDSRFYNRTHLVERVIEEYYRDVFLASDDTEREPT